jgi:tRNA pseudouridine55 synthase
MDGLLVIAKPTGPSSHDVVARLRRVLGERRIGHTGTLDPLASGVLPLVIGRATRLARFLSAADKAYDAVIRFGYATTTGDAEGAPTAPAYEGPWPSRDAVERALDGFRGTFRQRPPAFSAKKVEGRRSYHRARLLASRGAAAATIDAPPDVEVHLRHAELLALAEQRATVRLECSAGFYVRALAHDLGERLGTGAHLESLVRTRSGGLALADAVPLAVAEDALTGRATAAAAIIPLSRMLPEVTALSLTTEGVTRAVHGRDVRPEDVCQGVAAGARGLVRLLDPAGDLVGVAAPKEGTALLHPFVVLV